RRERAGASANPRRVGARYPGSVRGGRRPVLLQAVGRADAEGGRADARRAAVGRGASIFAPVAGRPGNVINKRSAIVPLRRSIPGGSATIRSAASSRISASL